MFKQTIVISTKSNADKNFPNVIYMAKHSHKPDKPFVFPLNSFSSNIFTFIGFILGATLGFSLRALFFGSCLDAFWTAIGTAILGVLFGSVLDCIFETGNF